MTNQPRPHSTAFLRQLQQRRETEMEEKQKGLGKFLPLLVVLAVLFPVLIPIAVPAAVVCLVWQKQKDRSQTKKTVHRKRTEKQRDFVVSPTFSEGEDGVWLSVQKQLEQAEVLKEAGVLSPEEYRIWRARIQDYNQK